ncbi:MAG: GNAT family N-acetyltransferase [Pseudomonadota bacterium]
MRTFAGWVLRRGAGGGKRVSAATGQGDPALAAAEMAAMAQPAIFRLQDQADLDADLAGQGYALVDPTLLYLCQVADLDDGRDETAKVIRCTTQLSRIEEIWDQGGIGPARRAVMARAEGPGLVLLARAGDRPAGCAFIACDGEIAMIHAIEVLPAFRRQGIGERLLRGAASFSAENGATWLGLAVTEANAPANALYRKLGMEEAGRYHYRIKE